MGDERELGFNSISEEEENDISYCQRVALLVRRKMRLNRYLSSSSKGYKMSQRDPQLNKPFIENDEVFPSGLPSMGSIQMFSYRELPTMRQCSFSQSILNGVNVLCGIGILSIPYAVKEGGWLGLSLLFIFGVISCYTGILLKRCLESSPGLQTYPDIGQAAFGTMGRLTITVSPNRNVFLLRISLCGCRVATKNVCLPLQACCVEFIILMSDNLSSLFPNASGTFYGIDLNSNYIFSILTTFVVLPTACLRDLSLLSYLSAGGVVASILVFLCLLWLGVVDKIRLHSSGTTLDLVNFPVAIGLYGVCYSGHSVFPNIYSSMKNPSQFPSVLLVSFIICWLLYTGVAICGFLMFGDALQSQFTLNMPKNLAASKIAAWTTVVNPLTKYAMTITPVALSLEDLLPSAHHKSHYVSVFIRTVLVLSTLVVALTVPFFGFVLALIGSLFAMLVALIFPCACYLRIHRGILSWSEV
ncbi:hypothetical protein GIB67_040554 [Kingdonia uniflora]|uniref:Amino acid transporter transmembrane domain-containing protein n=1 Tax=Kingdonia uniflora TaxID=39325 RepID=A0A7J7L5E9_9MAGN|nr:hypothetical protein GIB67_040554 [Kingdonia uniflora]